MISGLEILRRRAGNRGRHAHHAADREREHAMLDARPADREKDQRREQHRRDRHAGDRVR